jgi:hypothetical protein
MPTAATLLMRPYSIPVGREDASPILGLATPIRCPSGPQG